MASGHFYNIDSLLHQQNDAVKHTFLLGLSKEIKILISLRVSSIIIIFFLIPQLLIERISEVFSTDLTKVRHTISNDENLLRETANSDESGRNRTFLNRSSKKRAENSLKSVCMNQYTFHFGICFNEYLEERALLEKFKSKVPNST